MSRLAATLWITNVVLDTIGHLSFKASAMRHGPDEERRWMRRFASVHLWIGIVCFCAEFAVWFALLSVIPLSQAVLIGSINIVVVMIAGKMLFNEPLDAVRVAGISLIAIGVALAGGVP